MNLVFDCNVLVNAFIFKSSVSRQSWENANSIASVIISSETFEEYKRVFSHEKFDKYVSLQTRLEFLLDIQGAIKFVPVSHEVQVCRDPHDDMYLELALSGHASCIVTNDKDLLTLNPFENVSIISPKEFLEKF